MAVLAALATSAFAQSPDWYDITGSTDGNDIYSIKLHSGERTQNKGGEWITVVVGKISHKREGNVGIYKWYVTDTDCTQGYGNFVVLNLNDAYQFESPYAKGSKTIGSDIAKVICDVGEGERKKEAGKDI
jgi:hypothetical protein